VIHPSLTVMKNTLLVLLSVFAFYSGYSQTTKQTNALTPQVIEKFSVLKSNKKIREGNYTAAYNKGGLLAEGSYENGNRTGEWDFYDNKANHIQTYNYDTNTFTFLDTTGQKKIKYAFVKDIKRGDTVSNPIPIGGYYFVIVPMVFYHPELSAMIHKAYPGVQTVTCSHIFTITADGLISKHEVLFTIDGKNQFYTLHDINLDDEYKKFVPGMINHQAVESKIIATATLTFNGG